MSDAVKFVVVVVLIPFIVVGIVKAALAAAIGAGGELWEEFRDWE